MKAKPRKSPIPLICHCFYADPGTQSKGCLLRTCMEQSPTRKTITDIISLNPEQPSNQIIIIFLKASSLQLLSPDIYHSFIQDLYYYTVLALDVISAWSSHSCLESYTSFQWSIPVTTLDLSWRNPTSLLGKKDSKSQEGRGRGSGINPQFWKTEIL